MRRKITKGEVSKLLNIPKTQIRFYEKKGLIKPHIDENGYAMYTFSMVYDLQVILFLREMDTPVSEIQKMLLERDNYDYLEILEDSCCKIDQEMKRLARKKKEIKKKIDLFKRSSLHQITTEMLPERIVNVSEESLTYLCIKDAYDLSQKYSIDFNDFNNELCRIDTDKDTFTGLINRGKKHIRNSLYTITLPKGKYFTYTFSFLSFKEVDHHRRLFENACTHSSYSFDYFQLFIEHFAKTYYENGKNIATFQKRILSEGDTPLIFK